MVKKVANINGKQLKEMFAAATDWMEKIVPDIDALNVFPVPDDDCGTNMLLTMQSAIDETQQASNQDVPSVAQAMAKGALMGARGNSGVILSQFWRGLADSLEGKKTASGKAFARAFQQASHLAYEAVGDPIEGTILTVIREAASAADKKERENDADVISVLRATVVAAKNSVAETPKLLPALREAGVVDAGGQGLYTLLEGALLYLRGENQKLKSGKPRLISSTVPATGKPPETTVGEKIPFGYCTQFLLKGERLDLHSLREELKNKGQSLIVTGDENTVRIHIHTLDPDSIIDYASRVGKVEDVDIRNMDEQHEEFSSAQLEEAPLGIGIVAVVAGKGLAGVFKSLGASVIVPGGQTMNPSTKEILQAVEKIPSDEAIILPNNKNVVPSAQQVRDLTGKDVRVIATETIPQGITSLTALNREENFENNTKLMEDARSLVITIEVTHATRSAKLNDIDIKRGQAIGFLDGKLMASSKSDKSVSTEEKSLACGT